MTSAMRGRGWLKKQTIVLVGCASVTIDSVGGVKRYQIFAEIICERPLIALQDKQSHPASDRWSQQKVIQSTMRQVPRPALCAQPPPRTGHLQHHVMLMMLWWGTCHVASLLSLTSLSTSLPAPEVGKGFVTFRSMALMATRRWSSFRTPRYTVPQAPCQIRIEFGHLNPQPLQLKSLKKQQKRL